MAPRPRNPYDPADDESIKRGTYEGHRDLSKLPVSSKATGRAWPVNRQTTPEWLRKAFEEGV